MKKCSAIGIKGIIIPDLPVELAQDYVIVSKTYNIAPIFMFTPTTSSDRMSLINQSAAGFIYCQARLGVTGSHTTFDASSLDYIDRCKGHTDLPIAMGFGIQKKIMLYLAIIDFRS